MKNLEIPRLDSQCALCRDKDAKKTGSHMVPNLLTAAAFTFDGKAKRDHEIVEKYHLNSNEDNSLFYGREVSADKITSDLGHEITDEELEDNVNTLCYDHIFCKNCEERFGVVETAYGEYYTKGKEIHPRMAYLFWLSVFWRMSVGYMSLFMDAEDELQLRDILNRGLRPQPDITRSREDLGDFGYALFRLNEPLIKGDSGVLGTCKPCAPYIILVADYVVILFTHYSKLHQRTTLYGWEIAKEDINTADNGPVELELDIEEFHDFRKAIVEGNYGVFNPQQEEMARTVREHERSSGEAIGRKAFHALMNEFRQPGEETLRVRQAYRFRAAYIKMLEARDRGEAYDYLHDRELMLNEKDKANYIEDLKKLRAHGESLVPFAFAREFLHDDSIPSFEETFQAFKEYMEKTPPEMNMIRPHK